MSLIYSDKIKSAAAGLKSKHAKCGDAHRYLDKRTRLSRFQKEMDDFKMTKINTQSVLLLQEELMKIWRRVNKANGD